MSEDLFKGVEGGESTKAIEFMAQMKDESKKLKLETLRLQSEKNSYQASLNMLNEIETML